MYEIRRNTFILCFDYIIYLNATLDVPLPKIDPEEFTLGLVTVVIKYGDLTKENVDAIVNSTNKELDLSKGMLPNDATPMVKCIRGKCRLNMF